MAADGWARLWQDPLRRRMGAGGGPGGASSDRPGEGRANYGTQRSKPSAEQKSPSDRQYRSTWDRERHQQTVHRDIEQRSGDPPTLDKAAQPIAVLGKGGEAQIFMPAGTNERDPGNDEEAERDQLPRGEHRCRARTSLGSPQRSHIAQDEKA